MRKIAKMFFAEKVDAAKTFVRRKNDKLKTFFQTSLSEVSALTLVSECGTCLDIARFANGA